MHFCRNFLLRFTHFCRKKSVLLQFTQFCVEKNCLCEEKVTNIRYGFHHWEFTRQPIDRTSRLVKLQQQINIRWKATKRQQIVASKAPRSYSSSSNSWTKWTQNTRELRGSKLKIGKTQWRMFGQNTASLETFARALSLLKVWVQKV